MAIETAVLPLSDEDRLMWEARLKEAQKAHHELLTGSGVAAFTDQNGERVSFSKVDLKALKQYIADLVALLGTAPTAVTSTHPRPLRFVFGR